MNIPNELVEMQEQIFTAEELTQQIEMCETGLAEAMKEGSSDMVDYYKEKLEELKEMKAGQNDEIHFGGYHAGLTANQWKQKAAEEFVENGKTLDYKRYISNAAKASD